MDFAGHLPESLVHGKWVVNVLLGFLFRSQKTVCFFQVWGVLIRDTIWSVPVREIFREAKSCLPISQARQLSPRKSKRLLIGSRCGI